MSKKINFKESLLLKILVASHLPSSGFAPRGDLKNWGGGVVGVPRPKKIA